MAQVVSGSLRDAWRVGPRGLQAAPRSQIEEHSGHASLTGRL